ncbi:hypothetical protein SteCoe_20058 [Stentor coeruleus]|uniref:Uncharacterized protein n=1 Tax=Stentor coeruleus TaxID=5963 RepID=A0A1R2BSS8_9CILI|nr:hypothetical protein SteCoe_20058 [Stentor coeruleus]
MFFICFQLILSASLTIEEKEEACYLLSTASIAKRHNEIHDHAKSREDLLLEELKPKLSEDTFNYCMESIAEELALKIIGDRTHAIVHSKNFNIGLERYKTKDDVKSDKSFYEVRKRMNSRLASRKSRK